MKSNSSSQSNSKSEDTPRMIDVHRKQLRAQRWLQDNTHEGMTPEPPQDTSLTEITAEYFMATDPDRVALQRKVLAWHKAERAKLFEQIRSEVIKADEYPDEHFPTYLGHKDDALAKKFDKVVIRDRLKAEQREALTRLEKK